MIWVVMPCPRKYDHGEMWKEGILFRNGFRKEGEEEGADDINLEGEG